MKAKVISLVNHPLISGSTVIFLGSLLSNFINFLFNLFMNRNISIAEFGTFSSLISLMTLPGFLGGAILPTTVYFAASIFANNDMAMARGLYSKVAKLCLLIGGTILLFFIIFAELISEFSNIQNTFLVIIVGVIIFISYIGTVNTAFLQAKLSFTFLTLMNFFGSLLRLGSGVLFIYLGFSLYGVMTAILIAYTVPYLFSFTKLHFLFTNKIKSTPIKTQTILQYGAPAALAWLGLTSFITTDIILVKHFFSHTEAGIYSGISLLSRIIFFFSAPIGTVMFPMIVQMHTKKEKYHHILFLALLLVFLSSSVLTVFYYLFPTFVIKLLYNKEGYLEGASYLGLFSMYISVYSLVTVLTNFYLSIKKTIICIPIIITAILQVIGIWVFHSSFEQVIILSFILMSLLFLYLLLYYVVIVRRETSH